MNDELSTLIIALYVTIDDQVVVERCAGRPTRLTDAELVTLAVLQALLGFHSESRWLRYAHAHLSAPFPYIPKQPGWNKRLRAALPLVKKAIRTLAVDTDFSREPQLEDVLVGGERQGWQPGRRHRSLHIPHELLRPAGLIPPRRRRRAPGAG